MAMVLLAAGHAVAAVTNPDGVAIIIGNRTYTGREVPAVKYADRDAQAMKRYVIDVLGYDENNVVYLPDATTGTLQYWFGRDDKQGQIVRYLRRGRTSDLIVYYSGHGVPGMTDGQSYLLPVDAEADTAETQGYPLKTLYAILEKSPARTITVILDACFAGQSGDGHALINRASVLVRPASAAPDAPGPRMTVIAASQANEVANWDDASRHGLFTEYFLRAVYGGADSPKYGGKEDGHITVAAVHNYLDDQMSYAAGRYQHRDQEVSVTGDSTALLAAFQPGHPPPRPALDAAPVVPIVATVPPDTLTPATPTPAKPPPAAPSATDETLRSAISLRQQGRVEEAFPLFLKAAQAGNAAAMSAVGDAYATGRGARKDESQALVWYRQAAAAGDAHAMNGVGFDIANGLGGETANPTAALPWYRAAASRGDSGGLNNLAFAYWHGQGVDVNITEAARLFKQAADLRNAIAMVNLAEIYGSAEWGMRDDATAARWYRNAADLGNTLAMFELGQFYRYGRVGGRPDLVVATQWLRSASDGGYQPARQALGEIQQAMAAPQAAPQPQTPPLPQPQPRSAAPPPAPQAAAPSFTPAPSSSPAAAGEAALNIGMAARVQLQRGLGLLGFQTGGLFSDFQISTRSAIAAYQQRAGLEPTGYMTQQTRERLVHDMEHADFGVTAQSTLQNNLGSNTPTTIPGRARVIYTTELARALDGRAQSSFVVIDAWKTDQPHLSIPGALWIPDAGSPGTFTDAIQQRVTNDLLRATNGKRDTWLVFLCEGPECWESYNAALRAMHAGYDHVLWYRGGMEVWTAAGQPTK
jgi:PQQ-dependent catabolism-associated CXXCW motif protein